MFMFSLPSAFGLVGWDANRDANLDPVPAVEAVDLQLEQPSLLELLPGVEQQHPLLESEQQQELYVQRATSAQGDINVDNLYCGALTNPDGDVVVSGDLCASSSLSPHHHASSKTGEASCAPLRRCNDGHVIVDRLESSYCRVQSTEVDTLVTPDTLSVDSLAVNGSLTAPANTSCDVVEVAGMRQWASAFLQTFDDAAEAASWRGGRAAACDGDGVLGGGCGCGSQEVTRTVTGLPEHSRLQARPARPWRRMWPPRPPLSVVTFPATGSSATSVYHLLLLLLPCTATLLACNHAPVPSLVAVGGELPLRGRVAGRARLRQGGRSAQQIAPCSPLSASDHPCCPARPRWTVSTYG